MKLLVLILFVAILASLASAVTPLFRRDRDPRRMVRALTVRISLSVILFILLLVAWWLGLIQPHGLAG